MCIVQNYVFLACTVIHPHLMYILKISCVCVKLNVDMCSLHLRTFAEIHPGFPEGCRKMVPRTVIDWLVLVMIVPPTCTPTIYQREHWKGKRLCWEPSKEAMSGWWVQWWGLRFSLRKILLSQFFSAIDDIQAIDDMQETPHLPLGEGAWVQQTVPRPVAIRQHNNGFFFFLLA